MRTDDAHIRLDSPVSPTGVTGKPLLLVFPHAGSGASAYRDFSKRLSTRFNVLVLQYPGRQDRAAEAPLDSLAAMAAGAFDDFNASVHRRSGPISAFGHSMGALVAFEFVRVAEAIGIEVGAMTASAAVAPCQVAAKPPHPSSDEDILNHLASWRAPTPTSSHTES